MALQKLQMRRRTHLWSTQSAWILHHYIVFLHQCDESNNYIYYNIGFKVNHPPLTQVLVKSVHSVLVWSDVGLCKYDLKELVWVRKLSSAFRCRLLYRLAGCRQWTLLWNKVSVCRSTLCVGAYYSRLTTNIFSTLPMPLPNMVPSWSPTPAKRKPNRGIPSNA